MVLVPVKCPYCESVDIKRNGHAENGKQRYICCNKDCQHKTFIESYTNKAYDPYIRSRIFFSIVNGVGTRATARILEIDKDTVTRVLKSIENDLWYVNYNYIEEHKDTDISMDLVRVDEAEMDEMWSFYQDKEHQIWLWWTITRVNL